MKKQDLRETKDIIINGYVFTLIKGRQGGFLKDDVQPNFMHDRGWALKSIVKQMIRCRKHE